MAKEHKNSRKPDTMDNAVKDESEKSPFTAATAVKTPKSPPPESPRSRQIRRQVLASFWLVIVLLGIPLWWRTTAVYKASLPTQDMSKWAEGKVG